MISMRDFVGNTDLIRLLRLSIMAAKERNQAMPHTLLKGPAGTGKTTLAEAIAHEFGTTPIVLTPNTAKKIEDLRKVFQGMPGHGYDQQGNIVGRINPQIVFIDECHQLSLTAQENLGIAMQDWRLAVRVGNRDAFEWVPRFTLIGATTLPGKLSKPFLDRFRIQSDFEVYTKQEAATIAEIHAKSQGLELEQGVAQAIANRSRGVARLVVRFLDRLADAAIVARKEGSPGRPRISLNLTETVFQQLLKIDKRGLTKSDVKILLQLANSQDPIGVDALAAITNEDTTTIQNTVEPYLVQEGFIARTKRGRTLTPEGQDYLVKSGYLNHARNISKGRVVDG